MTVLLLNASYEPLTIIPKRRAISLMLRGRVDSASEAVDAMRAANSVFEVPHVLRLRKYINVPRRGARWSRHGVFQRDKFECIFCGLRPGMKQGGKTLSRSDMTIDHIVPRSRGGRNSWGNTACACHRCNNRKADRLPNEAGLRLRWEPKTPRVDYLVASGEVPDAWKLYLKVSVD